EILGNRSLASSQIEYVTIVRKLIAVHRNRLPAVNNNSVSNIRIRCREANMHSFQLGYGIDVKRDQTANDVQSAQRIRIETDAPVPGKIYERVAQSRRHDLDRSHRATAPPVKTGHGARFIFVAGVRPIFPRSNRESGPGCGYRPFEVLHFRSEEHTSELQSRENLVCRL